VSAPAVFIGLIVVALGVFALIETRARNAQ
jgi:hypothetical protein